MTNWRDEHDDEGFPVCNEDREGEAYIDEYGAAYVCQFVPGLGWVWAPYTVTPDE
jgi:hypothetical protein